VTREREDEGEGEGGLMTMRRSPLSFHFPRRTLKPFTKQRCVLPTAWPVALPRLRAMMGISLGPKATTNTPAVTIHSPRLNPNGMEANGRRKGRTVRVPTVDFACRRPRAAHARPVENRYEKRDILLCEI